MLYCNVSVYSVRILVGGYYGRDEEMYQEGRRGENGEKTERGMRRNVINIAHEQMPLNDNQFRVRMEEIRYAFVRPAYITQAKENKEVLCRCS